MPSVKLTLSVNPSGYTNSYWTGPSNGLVVDGASAYVKPGSGSSRTFTYDTNASAMIPANAVITGVRMDVAGYVSIASGTEMVRAGPGVSGGTAAYDAWTAANIWHVFGGPGNTLGATSVADLAIMSVRVIQGTNSAVTHYIDGADAYADWEYPPSVNPFILMPFC